MKVIAFSCVHWMSPALQEEVYEYDELDYSPFMKLIDLVYELKPDHVVNLGDFTETYWETPPLLPDAYWNIPGLTKLRGNHDRGDGLETVVIDGVRYEHGHKLGARVPGGNDDTDVYVQSVREMARSVVPIVHGHTHRPHVEDGVLDVGSVTFSQTYGLIVDGSFEIRRLE